MITFRAPAPACLRFWPPAWLSPLLALLVVTGGGVLPPPAAAASPAKLSDLGPAPPFVLPVHGGGRASLAEYLERGPVILDFWATWCAPCRRALPFLQVLADRYADEGLTVLAVSEDDPRNQPQIGPFLQANRLTFPVLLDADSRTARLYRVVSVPTTFLISPGGRVVALHRGYRDGDQKILKAEVEALLAGALAAEQDR